MNPAGIRDLSIPRGVEREGLPIRVQVMGPPFQEGLLLQAGCALEKMLSFRTKKPPSELFR